jgi:hypothetical protein
VTFNDSLPDQSPGSPARRFATILLIAAGMAEEIGVWSELKLEIVEQYGAAYTKAFNNTPGVKKYYIDGFQWRGTPQVENHRLHC